MKTSDALTVVALLGVGYVAWKSYSGLKSVASSAAAAVGTYLNPASPQNLAYTAVNDVGAAVTGQPAGSFSLGTSIWGTLNPAQTVQDIQAVGGTPTASQITAAQIQSSVLTIDPTTGLPYQTEGVISSPVTAPSVNTAPSSDTYSPSLQYTGSY